MAGSDYLPTADRDQCEQEPIRYAGRIQPTGVLLCIDRERETILAASANHRIIPTLQGPLSGLTLGEVWPALAALRDDGVFLIDGTCLVHRHSHGRTIYIEIEPVTAEDHVALPQLIDLKTTLKRLQEADTLESTTLTAAEAIRVTTGMERVLIYRFDAEGNGEVLAESKTDDWDESFAGFHFPAADIPAQARALYLISPFRFVPHRDYEPVPLVPELDERDGQPFDLSLCCLRSLSPVHQQYQENLGVDGAMSVSILNEGRLWGLVVGHHRRPHRVSLPAREQVLVLIAGLAMKLSVTETAAEREAHRHHGSLHTKLLEQIAGADDFVAALLHGDVTLTDFFSASSGAVVMDCEGGGESERWEVYPCGISMDKDRLVAISKACRAHLVGGVFSTDHLLSIMPASFPHDPEASGLLAITVGEHGRHMILWFRPEMVRTTVWGGATPVQVNMQKAAGNYLPRRSFTRWVEEHHLHSLPWSPWMADIARSIRTAVNDNILRQLRTIRSLNALLKDRDQAKSRFLAHMSHELRAPLHTVAGYSEMMMAGDLGAITEGQREAVGCIREACSHLLDMINDILDLSKVEAGRMEVHLAPADLREITRRVIALQAGVAHSRGVGLLSRHPPDLPPLMVDERLVRQMLFNLISNAVKFTPERGSVTISTHMRDDGGVTLEVADTGIGIPKARQASVVEPFRQAHEHLAESHPGTGLGLPIVKSLIELHGGRLDLDSDEGSGTTVRLEFPPKATLSSRKEQQVWAALRAATAPSHAALETAPILKKILSPDVSTADLAELLGRLVRVYRPLEARLLDREPTTTLAYKRRLPLLIEGLAALDAQPPSADLVIPALDGEASRWGALYVVEGATMGGQLIHRHLAPHFPPEALKPFVPHGPETGENWRHFVASMEAALATPEAIEEAKGSAIDLFRTIHQAMQE